MREFLVLISQILIIILLQIILETLIDEEKRPSMIKFINIACYLGCLYIIFEFIYTYIIQEAMAVFNIFP